MLNMISSLASLSQTLRTSHSKPTAADSSTHTPQSSPSASTASISEQGQAMLAGVVAIAEGGQAVDSVDPKALVGEEFGDFFAQDAFVFEKNHAVHGRKDTAHVVNFSEPF